MEFKALPGERAGQKLSRILNDMSAERLIGLIGAKLHKTTRETWEETGNTNLRN